MNASRGDAQHNFVRPSEIEVQFNRGERWESASAMRAALKAAFQTVFGEPASTSVLSSLVGGPAKHTSAPVPRAPVPPSSVASSPESGGGAQSGATTPLGQAAVSSVVGGTTEVPTSQSFVQPIASRNVGLVVGVIAVLGIGTGLYVAFLRGSPPANAANAGDPVPSSAAVSTASPNLGARAADAPPDQAASGSPSSVAAPPASTPTVAAGPKSQSPSPRQSAWTAKSVAPEPVRPPEPSATVAPRVIDPGSIR